jgi:RNA polymerase sigma-70 factor, ECF subfamily
VVVEQRPDWIALVVAAQAGNAAAQGELLGRFEPLARATARRLVEPGLVDDVVQESFTNALRTIAGLRTAEAFPSWLRLIVLRQASRLRPSPREVALSGAPELVMPNADPAIHAERSEVSMVVRLALASVRDQDRRLLELRYLAGWTNEELADLLGVSPGAIRKRLHDARRRLRPHLEHLHPKEQAMTDYRTYLGAIHDPSVDVPAAPGLAAPAGERTVTGLKVIDTMAPIRRGGTIEMVGPAGTGHVVVVFELLYRIGRTEHDVACVGVGRAGAAIGSQPDLAHIVTETGIPGPNAAILGTDPADTARAFEAGSRLAAGLAAQGLDVILAVDRPSLEQLDAVTLTASAGLAAEGSVTVVALNAFDRSADTRHQMGLDTTLVFSLEHLALGIFPAIDGARSTSSLAVSDTAADAKARLADAADLRKWFNQALYVARDFTGEDGTWHEPDATETELADLTR